MLTRQASWPRLVISPHGYRRPDPLSSASAPQPDAARQVPCRPEETDFMQLLMIIWRTIVNLVKSVWLLPKAFAVALEQKRAQDTGRISEAERLDRIRNPAKYAGR